MYIIKKYILIDIEKRQSLKKINQQSTKIFREEEDSTLRRKKILK